MATSGRRSAADTREDTTCKDEGENGEEMLGGATQTTSVSGECTDSQLWWLMPSAIWLARAAVVPSKARPRKAARQRGGAHTHTHTHTPNTRRGREGEREVESRKGRP